MVKIFYLNCINFFYLKINFIFLVIKSSRYEQIKGSYYMESSAKSNFVELSSSDFLEDTDNQMNINNEENQEFEEIEENKEFNEIEQESEEFVNFTLNEDGDNNNNDDESPDSSTLEANFGQFLDVWVEILVEETEEFMGIAEEENNKMSSLEIEDIIHPAVDSNTKWDLNTLFNELQLP